jgi:CRISPR-associated protein Cas2
MDVVLCGYRLMWIMVMFDLPVMTAGERRIATRFRNFLEKEGFGMCQFSVYAKYCGPREKLDSIEKMVNAEVPDKGRVNIIHFTDKQFGQIKIIENNRHRHPKENPEQLLIFGDDDE